MHNNENYIADLYCRLSKDDVQDGESISIGTQRSILIDYCVAHQYEIHKIYVDDGYSGLNFDRPGFQALLSDIESGAVNLVITKDLSRLGRDYIMTGYYSEIYFPSKGVRYIAIADDFDSLKQDNDIAPFRNILNYLYARDISRKIRNAKRQRAKQGLFIGSQTPYGYTKDPINRNQLIVDPEAAYVVTMIFSLAEQGLGNVSIAKELEAKQIVTPAVYKYQHGDKRFERYSSVKNRKPYEWCPATISQILNNPVYTGTLISLKTETVDCKTKQRRPVPAERQIETVNAHEAIISQDTIDRIKEIRKDHKNDFQSRRENIFRGKLFCACCGHPLAISRKKLLYREADLYQCMHHYKAPDECPRTHRVYYDMLYPYVLQEIQAFAKGMRRRRINSAISDYSAITELTPKILDDIIERIEIGHVTKKSKPGKAIRIYWKLK
jgi:DNA invertase Pin-like site-specific DNA recombinase